MAKRKKSKGNGSKRGRKSKGNGSTIKEKTEAFNALVAQANRAGAKWAKKHTSDFGSHEAADKMLKRIRASI